MATKFSMTRDINGYNGFGLIPTDTAYSATLAAATDTSLTVPHNASLGGAAFYDKPPVNFVQTNGEPTLLAIIVSDPGASVWVAKNTAAAPPGGAAFTATASALNPAAYEVRGGDVLHFYSVAANANVSVRFYWLT